MGSYNTTYYTVSKNCEIFLNNSVKHWLILIIFGVQNHETTLRQQLLFWPLHINSVATLPCEM